MNMNTYAAYTTMNIIQQAEGMEGSHGKEGPPSEHVKDEVPDLRRWAGRAERHREVSLCRMQKWRWKQLHPMLQVQPVGTQTV